MNIAMFSDTYVPQKNGVATALKLYKESMKKMGHRVYMFVPKLGIDSKRHEDDVFEFPAFKFTAEKDHRIALPISTDIFKANKLDLDVIHSHSPFSMGIAADLVAKALDLPYVGTHHTMYEYYRHYVPFIFRPSLKQAQKLIRNWCIKLDKVIAPTKDIKDVLVQYGVPAEHIAVIPTGIDTYSFDGPVLWDIRKEYSIGEEEKILLFVGRLAEEKNIVFLIKMFSKLIKQTDQKYKFVIVGDGPEREKLEELSIELDLHDSIIFTGGQPREKVIDAYKQSDLFVFASYTETQGLVVLEAMAACTPVVALGKMGVRDLLSQKDAGGIMIDELNENEFIDSIIKLTQNKELYEKYSEKACNFVRNNYSINVTGQKIVEVYSQAIRGIN